MEQSKSSKGKPVTTSVPSIAIKFHANDEQLEEFYPAISDDEQHSQSTATETVSSSSVPSTSTTAVNESDSSPLKYLPRLVKRSTSIDITPTTKPQVDASPPSDPWRFFSDIKGKITKSVEDKITEIKSRNQEEGSPLKSKNIKDTSKDNSSVSDSEELSESSISKTCGIVSTTEGAEMSSDDEDTPSIEKDKDITQKKKEDHPPEKEKSNRPSLTPPPPHTGLRQRFRLLKHKTNPTSLQKNCNITFKEGSVPVSGLAKLYNINTERVEQALPEDDTLEIESGVEAMEHLEDSQETESHPPHQNEEITTKILEGVVSQYENIGLDPDGALSIKLMHGDHVKHVVPTWSRQEKKVYSPVGFVDFRVKLDDLKQNNSQYYWSLSVFILLLVLYLIIQMYYRYLAGMIAGIAICYGYFWMRSFLCDAPRENRGSDPDRDPPSIYEIPAIKEHQPLQKYEGWMNELPEAYNPYTYHVSQTQSVFVRLQSNLLRLSHTRQKIPKRALWNEPKINPAFTTHRVYNLLEAQITLLPEGLARKRYWSKKYPICITLSANQLDLGSSDLRKFMDLDNPTKDSVETIKAPPRAKRPFHFKKKKVQVEAQRFSKLTEEEEEFEMESDNSRPSTPSPLGDSNDDLLLVETPEIPSDIDILVQENLQEDLKDEDDLAFDDALSTDWSTFTQDDSPTTETKLYLFARTDREKEDWFRRLTRATHKGAHLHTHSLARYSTVSEVLVDYSCLEDEYLKFMSLFNKTSKRRRGSSQETVRENSNERSVASEGSTAPAQTEQKSNQTSDKEKDKSQTSTSTSTTNDSSTSSQAAATTTAATTPTTTTTTTQTQSSPSPPPSSSSTPCPGSHDQETTAPSNDLLWINALVCRVLFDCLRDPKFTERVKERIERKLAAIKLPYFIEELLITELSLGHSPILIRTVSKPLLDERGLWIDLDLEYEGLVVLTLQTQLNLMKLKQAKARASEKTPDLRHAMFNSDVDDSAESTSDDDYAHLFHSPSQKDEKGQPLKQFGGPSNASKKFVKMVDKIAESRFFQAASENRYIKKAMEGVSNTDLRLKVEVKELTGTLVVNVPPPPTDRIWMSFRPVPHMLVSAHPIVGERNITFVRISNWIEKKLYQEFQKVLVIPNMEDFSIPVMDQKLPQ